MRLLRFNLHIEWLCCGSNPVRTRETAFVINEKIKKFPSLLSPESLDDTAFGAVSSKLADYSGDPYGNRTHVTAVKGRCLNRLTNGPYKRRSENAAPLSGSGTWIRTGDTAGMNRML